jgi:hypothetical protein
VRYQDVQKDIADAGPRHKVTIAIVDEAPFVRNATRFYFSSVRSDFLGNIAW